VLRQTAEQTAEQTAQDSFYAHAYASGSSSAFGHPDFDSNRFDPREHTQFIADTTSYTDLTTDYTIDLTTGFETPAPAQQDTSENSRDSFLTKLVVKRDDKLRSILTTDTRHTAHLKDYQKGSVKTRDGYTHLHKWATRLKDCATYNNYTYEEAVEAYNEIETAYGNGTYNKTLKDRCKRLELPFASTPPHTH
jgi:hypothetical protein